ncbi:unnamed protein product [Closterium sp. NIES-53]
MWRRGLDPLRKLTRGDLRGTEKIAGWRGNDSAVYASHLRLVRTCVPSVLTPSVPPTLPPPLPSAAPNTAAEAAAAAATTLTGSAAPYSFRNHVNGPAEPAADSRLTAAVASSAAAAAALGLSAVHSAEAPEGDCSNAGVGSGREVPAGGARSAVDWGGAGKGEGGEGAAVGSKHTARWRVFTDRGRELFSQGRLRDAERYLQRAIEEAKAGFGPSDPHVASSCNNLAELYRVMGEWEAAERLFQEATERFRAVEMPLPLAATLHNLGGLYLQQAQLGQGQVVYSQPGNAEMGQGQLGQAQLGQAQLGQAHLEKARVCYEEALKLKAKELGESHPDYANTMFHLAEVFRRLGRREEAHAVLRGSVKILEGSAGSRGTTAMARRMMLLAQMLVQSASAPAATLPASAAMNGQWQGQQGQQKQGDRDSSKDGDAELLREAERLQRRAIHAVEMGEGTEAPALSGMLASLATTLEKQGRLEEARDALLRSLHLRQAALGLDHFLVASTLTPLAAVTLKMLSRPQQQQLPTDAPKGERVAEDGEKKELEEALHDLHCAVRVARKAWQQAAEKLTAAAAGDDAGGRRGDRVQGNKSRNTPPPSACLTLLVSGGFQVSPTEVIKG